MGFELFERAANAGAQLLRTECLAAGASGAEIGALLLTFDVGAILVRANGRAETLEIENLSSVDDLPAGLVGTDEEEPWWRVLGNPLSRAWQKDEAVCLQFRPDEDAPRIVSLAPSAGRVAVRLENPPTPEQ